MRFKFKNFLLSITLLISFVAQAQNGLNFQGVARNSNNVILASQPISLRLSIVQGTTNAVTEYTEVRKVTTNAQGLFNVVIGDTGTVSVVGNFSTIDWKLTPKFLKIEMDIAAGNNFSLIGTTQFQSVAYAQFASQVDAEKINGVLPVAKGGTGVASITALKASLALDKASVGLTNVDNTSDALKPISTPTQTALDTKVDKVAGKGLSTNDYTTVEKTKLAAITGTNTGDQDLSSYATNAAITLKENAANKSTATDLGASATSDILFPTQKAVKTYVDGQISSGGVSDGSILTRHVADGAITTIKIANSAVDLTTKVTGILPTSKGGTGTITATANTFFAAPDGTSGAPSFRGIQASDIPSDLSSYIQSTPMSPQAASIDIGGGARIGGRGIIGNDLFVNNIYMGIGGTGQNNTNTAIGNSSLQGQDDGYGNTTLGTWTMKDNNGGYNNTSIGANALQNISIGNDNTAIGNYAMLNSTTGNFNTASGALALSANTSTANTGSYNVANGYKAIPFNQTGSYNVGVGYLALNSNTTGSNNTAIGNQANVALGSLTNATAIGNGAIVSGSNQIQLGNTSVTLVKTSGGITLGGTLTANAGVFTSTTISGDELISGTLTANTGVFTNTTISSNAFIGGTLFATSGLFGNTSIAGSASITGTLNANDGFFTSTTISGNTSIGGTLNVTGATTLETLVSTNDLLVNGLIIGKGAGNINTNTVLGIDALVSNTTGEANIAIGKSSLKMNTSGRHNFAAGFLSLFNNTIGGHNTAIGDQSLYNNLSGSNNFAVGESSSNSNTIGRNNISIGSLSLRRNTEGNDNLALGFETLPFNTTGNGNIAIGYQSFFSLTTGNNNLALGNRSLGNFISGSDNIAIGRNAGNDLNYGTNNILLGIYSQPSSTTVSNEITLGNSSSTSLRSYVPSITSLSDRRDKTDIVTIAEGINFIKQLKPVTFTWNTRDKSKVGIKSAGFIAQDLLALQKGSLIGANLDLVSENNPEKLEARYNNLLPVIVKAIQDQQNIIEEQKNRLDALEKLVNELLKKQ